MSKIGETPGREPTKNEKRKDPALQRRQPALSVKEVSSKTIQRVELRAEARPRWSEVGNPQKKEEREGKGFPTASRRERGPVGKDIMFKKRCGLLGRKVPVTDNAVIRTCPGHGEGVRGGGAGGGRSAFLCDKFSRSLDRVDHEILSGKRLGPTRKRLLPV